MCALSAYANNEALLKGIALGIEHVNDSAVGVAGFQESDQQEYQFMLVTFDEDGDEDECRYL